MKRIFELKGRLIFKSIIFQIAMSIFGIMLAMAVLAINEKYLVFAGVFSVLFYFALAGAAFNEDGLADNLKIKGNRLTEDKLLGLKCAAVYYIPTFIITVLQIVFYYTVGADNPVFQLLNMVNRFFTSGMYLSLDRVLFATGDTFEAISYSGIIYIVYQLFSVIVLGIFYYLGVRGINLLGKPREK